MRAAKHRRSNFCGRRLSPLYRAPCGCFGLVASRAVRKEPLSCRVPNNSGLQALCQGTTSVVPIRGLFCPSRANDSSRAICDSDFFQQSHTHPREPLVLPLSPTSYHLTGSLLLSGWLSRGKLHFGGKIDAGVIPGRGMVPD